MTPDTILRWHRNLIAAKWTYSKKGSGRPGVLKEIRALMNLKHEVAESTVLNVLKRHGILPAPQRPTSWRGFLKAHWSQVVATDFFTVEAWTGRGLRTVYVLKDALPEGMQIVRTPFQAPNANASAELCSSTSSTTTLSGITKGSGMN